MEINVDIRKKLGDFTLNIAFKSSAKRIGILGASGCGKSLTLKCIAGIERPDRGTIGFRAAGGGSAGVSVSEGDSVAERTSGGGSVAERTSGGGSSGSRAAGDSSAGSLAAGMRVLFDSASRTDLKPQKRRVGYMFQNYALFPTMSVEANIGAGLHLPAAQRRDRVAEMIDRFHLQGLEKHLPGQLSGGQQQRVALARIMAYQPDLILLDEPFSALDQHLKERLQHEMMTMLEDCECQVIMVSHSRDELYRFSEDLIIMEDGHLLAQGPTRQLFDNPGTIAVARMTGCKNFSRAVRLDAHHLRLTDWNMDLQLARQVPENITAIGYRAHFFRPVWGERTENCLPFRLSGTDELPFERRYYLLPSTPEESVLSGAESFSSGAKSASSGAGSVLNSAESFSSGAGSVLSGAESASSGAGSALSGAESASSGAGNALSGAESASSGAGRKTEEREVRAREASLAAESAGFGDSANLICWFVQDQERNLLDCRPTPDYLQLRENAVMLLHD